MRGAPRAAVVMGLVAGASFLADVAHAQRACVLESPSVDLGRVIVTPPSTPPFDVIARAVTVVATIGEAGKTGVHVRGSLAFRGLAKSLHLRFANPAMYTRPPLWLGPKTQLLAPRRASGGRVQVEIPLAEGVTATGVEARCSDLSLVSRREGLPGRAALPDSSVHYPAGEELVVWEKRGSGAKVVVRVQSPSDLPLPILRTEGGYHEVDAYLPGGRVGGYVSTASVSTPSAGGLHGSGTGRGGCGCMGPSRQWARIQEGARVYARPGAHQWATVPAATYGLAAPFCTKGYAQLYQTPDVVGTGGHGLMDHAWVSAKALSLPRGGAWSCE